MRPKLLKIKGVNSFYNQQTIDFCRLTEKGLFGIFGPTGSGKSSILDAITLALYGDLARDSKEFINTEAEEAQVSFEFQIQQGKEVKTYRVDRGIKRKKNGGLETSLARMIEIQLKEKKVICEGVMNVNKEIIKLIGLKSEDFTRSVVLPQGKFSEFLKLTGLERRNMLERIFGLQKYGRQLMDKIKGERKIYEMKKLDLEGQLKGYEGITEEYYKEIKTKLEQLLEEEQIIKKSIEVLEKEYEEKKKIRELQLELKGYIQEKITLEGEKENIEEKRVQIERTQRANRLYSYVEELETLEERLKEKKEKYSQLLRKLPVVQERLQQLEKEYDQISQLKDKEFPILFSKIEGCRQGELVVQEYRGLEKETGVLQLRLKNLTEDMIVKKEEVENLKEKKALLLEGIQREQGAVEKMWVDPDIRKVLEEGSQLEIELEVLEEEKRNIHYKLNYLKEEMDRNRNKRETKEELRKKCENRISDLEKWIVSIEEHPVYDEKNLYDKKILLEKQCSQLAISLENQKIYEIIKKEIEGLNREKQSLIEKRNILIQEIEEEKENLEVLRHQSKEQEITYYALYLVKELQEGQPCPVCGAKEHPTPAKSKDGQILLKINGQLEKAEEHYQRLMEQKRNIEIMLAQIEAEYDIKEKVYKEKEEYIKEKNMDQLMESIKALQEETEKLVLEREKLLKNKKRYQEQLEKERKELLEISSEIIKLKTEMKKDKQGIDDYKEKLREIDEKLEQKELLYKEIRSSTKLEKITVEYEKIKIQDRERMKKEILLKKMREELEKESRQSEGLEQQLNILNLELTKYEQRLQEKQGQLKVLEEKKFQLVGNRHPKEYRIFLERKIDELQSTELQLKKRVEKGKLVEKEMLEERTMVESHIGSLEEDSERKKNILYENLKKQGFGTIEEVKGYRMEENMLNRLIEVVMNYDDQRKNVINNINRIEQLLKGQEFCEKQWLELETTLMQKRENYEEKSRNVGEVQQILKDIKKKLEQIKGLKQQEKSVTQQLDLLIELNKMVEGNKFVEYVAINQLKYIAREASKRLKEITRGRYTLELDVNGNFIMRDDFNGGIRRATNTLSGGETFLTSLALALALSSQIQLKGSAPLEFFFLDEGFGTLDNDLLEIVMTSLERLHSEKLSVGIISHVDELRNRVPVRLIVMPPQLGGEGTTVKIM